MIPLVDRDLSKRRVWEEILGVVIVVASVAYVVASLHPRLWFTNTTTNGGDMGAHVWWPATLRDHWFGQLRLSGWSPDWYAGFPVGQFYFPFPAVSIVALDVVMPYNIVFKLVAVSGAVLLPVAAYVFARSIRVPWPAPPLFAVAATRTLFETRIGLETEGQAGHTIYGGNLPSILAGEFSYTIGLAMGLFFLAALATTLRTGNRRWLPALLLAATVTSHIVIAVLAVVGALVIWLTHRPHRTFFVAAGVGITGALLSAVWWLPLLAAQSYTTSMRYEKKTQYGAFLFGLEPGADSGSVPKPLWLWLFVGAAIVLGVWWQRWSTLGLVLFTATFGVMFRAWPADHHVWNARFLPLYYLGLAFLAAAGAAELTRVVGHGVLWARRWVREGDRLDAEMRVSALAAAGGGGPIDAEVGGSVGVESLVSRSELVMTPGAGSDDARSFDDATARVAGSGHANDPAIDPATDSATDSVAEPALVGSGNGAFAASGRVAVDPVWGSTPDAAEPALSAEDERRDATTFSVAVALGLVLVSFVSLIWIRGPQSKPGWVPGFVWDAVPILHEDNRWAIPGWAKWNFTGYEKQKAYPEYREIMETLGELPAGRLLWEPSAGDPDYIDAYGTSLALELIPYFTDGRIGSMEGLYFEAASTTPYHFLTVSELADRPSNPVRGLQYGTLEDDFDLGVDHLRMLGVRYFMPWSPAAIAKADASSELELVATIPAIARAAMSEKFGSDNGEKWNGWRVYEVRDVALVEGLKYEPVVAQNLRSGTTSECFEEAGDYPKDADRPEANIVAWECAATAWFQDPNAIDQLFAKDGPDNWQRVEASWAPCRDFDTYPQRKGTGRPCQSPYRALVSRNPRTLPKVSVTNIEEDVDAIRFSVDQIDVPVLVKASYFPNWRVKGAKGPYPVSPSLMVVIPTEENVELTYGLTAADWGGRVAWLFGIAGVVLLVLVRPRFADATPKRRRRFGFAGFGAEPEDYDVPEWWHDGSHGHESGSDPPRGPPVSAGDARERPGPEFDGSSRSEPAESPPKAVEKPDEPPFS